MTRDIRPTIWVALFIVALATAVAGCTASSPPVAGDAGVVPNGAAGDGVRREPVVAGRRARVFVGHAGWGPGQLEAELEANMWIVEPATPGDIFTAEPAALWRHVLERKGPPFDTLAKMPYDPRVN